MLCEDADLIIKQKKNDFDIRDHYKSWLGSEKRRNTRNFFPEDWSKKCFMNLSSDCTCLEKVSFDISLLPVFERRLLAPVEKLQQLQPQQLEFNSDFSFITPPEHHILSRSSIHNLVIDNINAFF